MPSLVTGWIEVEEYLCKGCELCISACPMKILELDQVMFNAKGYHPVQMIGESCTGCAICAIICPEAAITVYREKITQDVQESNEKMEKI